MSTVPVQDADGARRRVGLVVRRYGDRINFYASTGCEGVDVGAVTVAFEGPGGRRDTLGCRDEGQLLLGCGARELEGSVRCGDRCGDTTLMVVHRAHVPPSTRLPALEPTSCGFDDGVLSCSYPVTMDTISVSNAWTFEGENHLCVTMPVGEQRIPLSAVSETNAHGALIRTPAGTAIVDATTEAIQAALTATGGLREVTEEESINMCRDDASDA